MINWIKNNKFRAVLLFVLTCIFVYMIKTSPNSVFTEEGLNVSQQNVVVNSSAPSEVNSQNIVKIFYSPYCPHCHHLDNFIESNLKDKYPTVIFEKHNVLESSERDLFAKMMSDAGLDPTRLGTPTVFLGDDHIIGFRDAETTGKQLIKLIDKNFFDGSKEESKKKSIDNVLAQSSSALLNNGAVHTSFGDISLNQSLPVISIVLGLVDGFNPCAMWVLIYLISIIMTLQDRKKMFLIVGTFVTAEAIMYYLLLNFWLSTFLLIGAIKIVTLIVGLVAIYFGLIDLKTYFTKEDMTCHVGNIESKNRTKNKIKSIVNAEITIATMLGLIGLAVVVNSMEFLCSAGIPAVFSQVLANAGISGFMKQMYIILYDFFFMIDDFIIFGLAVFAIDRYVGDKYMRISKLLGGAVLFILGIIMVFFPQYLQ